MVNKEGYRYPTAEAGIKRAMRMTDKLNLVRQIIYLVCKLANVRLVHAVELEDKRGAR